MIFRLHVGNLKFEKDSKHSHVDSMWTTSETNTLEFIM